MNRIAVYLFVTLLLSTHATGRAQVPGSVAPGLNSSLIRLFGRHTEFSARTDVRMLDRQAQKESLRMTMDLAVLGGKVRADIDMTQIHSAELDPAELARMKQIGMEKFSMVLRPDEQATFYIYPSLSAYVRTPTPTEAEPKVESKKLGKERVNSHPCAKYKFTLKGAGTDRIEALVWQAEDLKGFPVKVQIHQPDAVVVMEFTNVQLTKPDAKKFDAPAGYTKHSSIDQIILNRLLGK